MENELEYAQRAILQSIPDIAWLKDLDSRYVAVNDAYAKLLGRNVSDFTGKTDEDLWAPEQARIYRSEDQKVLLAGERLRFEARVIDQKGNAVWFESIKTPLRDRSGKLIGTSGIARDITDRKRLESELQRVTQQFQIIFDTIPATVWLKNTENEFVRVNRATVKLLGLRPDQIEGKSAYEIFPAEEAERYHRDDLEVILSKKAKMGIIEEAHTATGEVKIVRTDKIPSLDENGNVTGIVCIAIDITELMKSEAEREALLRSEQKAREEAVRANEAKDRFFAMLSHELRTPVTTILSWAQLLKISGGDATRVKRAIAMIEQAAQNQTKLIDDLLDVSKIISGKMPISLDEVDLVQPIVLALEAVRPTAESKGISLQTDLAGICEKVLGDTARLQQIFYNLLANAVKFTPTGGIINVRIRCEGEFVRIEVQDNGPGISPGFLPYIFDPFRQADTSTTRKFGGLGLGLAIARGLVEAHGGTIKAESEGAGKGATLTVKLRWAHNSPLRSEMIPAEKKYSESEITKEWLDRHRQILKNVRVLLVDDEEGALEALEETLNSFGLIVRSARSAREALSTLKDFDASLLISDIAMPGTDGYELLKQARDLPGRMIPAIALTAFASKEDAEKAKQNGFQAHLAKPVDTSTLIDTIAMILQLKGRSTSGVQK